MMMIIKPLPIEMPIDIPIYIPSDIPFDIPNQMKVLKVSLEISTI